MIGLKRVNCILQDIGKLAIENILQLADVSSRADPKKDRRPSSQLRNKKGQLK